MVVILGATPLAEGAWVAPGTRLAAFAVCLSSLELSNYLKTGVAAYRPGHGGIFSVDLGR